MMIQTKYDIWQNHAKAFGVTGNTLVYFPMVPSQGKGLYDYGPSKMLLTDGNADATIALGTAVGSMSSQSGAPGDVGATPDAGGPAPAIPDDSKSFLFWSHGVPRTAVTNFRFQLGTATTRVNIPGGATGQIFTGLNLIAFSTTVVGQEAFRAIYFDADNDLNYSLEATNGAAVAVKGSSVPATSFAGITFPVGLFIGLNTGAADFYSCGGSYVANTYDGTSILALCEQIITAGKGSKILPKM